MTTCATPTPKTSSQRQWLPSAPLRNRVLIAAASGLGIVAGLAFAMHGWLDTVRSQPLVAVLMFFAAMVVVVITIRSHHPFVRLGPANRVTMMRAVLVALVASLINEPARVDIAWVIVVATAVIATLDGVDGWLARRSGMSSTFGARFDMETDAFFMLVLSALVWRHQKAGLWVLGIGLMRYTFVFAGWLMPWAARPFKSTQRGKTVAIAQLVVLGFALVPQVAASLSAVACAIALATLTWSFSVDVRNLWNHRHEN